MDRQRRPRPAAADDGDLVPAWIVRREAVEQRPSAFAGLLGLLVVLLSAALLLTHGLTLATSRAQATRSLGAVLPALTDLDQALATHAEGITATAEGSGATVPIPGLPFAVDVPSAAAQAGGAPLRAATLNALTRALYQDGPLLFRSRGSASEAAPALLSGQWALERALSLHTAATHERLLDARRLLAPATVVAALLLALLAGRRRLVAVGSAVLVGAIVALVLAALARVGVWLFTAGDGELLAASVARLTSNLSMTVVYTAAVAAATGVALLVVGAIAGRVAPTQAYDAAPMTRRRTPETERARAVQRRWEEP